MEQLKTYLKTIEAKWGVRPFVVLACSGYADEHWQVWHPDEMGIGEDPFAEHFPIFVISADGADISVHPDAIHEYAEGIA
jgi:hypothetical protein